MVHLASFERNVGEDAVLLGDFSPVNKHALRAVARFMAGGLRLEEGCGLSKLCQSRVQGSLFRMLFQLLLEAKDILIVDNGSAFRQL